MGLTYNDPQAFHFIFHEKVTKMSTLWSYMKLYIQYTLLQILLKPHQASHFSWGFIYVSVRQLKSSANSSKFLKAPITRYFPGDLQLLAMLMLRASVEYLEQSRIAEDIQKSCFGVQSNPGRIFSELCFDIHRLQALQANFSPARSARSSLRVLLTLSCK